MIKEAQNEDPLGLGAGPEEPKPVRYRTNDSSYEAIGALLVSNPAGLLVRLSPALEAHLAKYRKLVPALALIDHLAEAGAGGVGKEALLRALAMAEYLETHARRLYGATDTIDIIAAEAILAHIRRGALKDGFTARDVHQSGWSKLTDR